jgi:hypothetical protein
MLEMMLWLECLRQHLRKKLLPTIGDNSYHFVGTVLALIFATGSLGVALPASGFSFVTFLVTGIIAILTIVLLPIGLILL